eukprot:scaffold2821_cov240-Pinguiococcus_pyrenoidosus.AAC.2
MAGAASKTPLTTACKSDSDFMRSIWSFSRYLSTPAPPALFPASTTATAQKKGSSHCAEHRSNIGASTHLWLRISRSPPPAR